MNEEVTAALVHVHNALVQLNGLELWEMKNTTHFTTEFMNNLWDGQFFTWSKAPTDLVESTTWQSFKRCF